MVRFRFALLCFTELRKYDFLRFAFAFLCFALRNCGTLQSPGAQQAGTCYGSLPLCFALRSCGNTVRFCFPLLCFAELRNPAKPGGPRSWHMLRFAFALLCFSLLYGSAEICGTRGARGPELRNPVTRRRELRNPGAQGCGTRGPAGGPGCGTRDPRNFRTRATNSFAQISKDP